MGYICSALAHFLPRICSRYFASQKLVGDVEEFCAPPAPVDDSVMNGCMQRRTHRRATFLPYGDVYPCAAVPLACGNVRQGTVLDIWPELTQLREVR